MAGSDQERSLLSRTLRIMECFNAGSPELSLTEIVRRSGLPRSSVHRILTELVRLGGIERSGTKYRLGLRMIELGALAMQHNRLRDVAVPFLHELYKATGHLVHLALLDGHEIVYLEKIGGVPGARTPSRLGGRQPAYCTGAGKAMLAYAPESTVAAVLAAGLPARAPGTITQPRVFRQELGRIRDHGVAYDREECFRDIACVAAPIRRPGDGPGQALAAVSVSGAPTQLNPAQVTPLLLATTRNIWQVLSAPHPAQLPRTAPAGTTPQAAGDDLGSWSSLTGWM